MSLLDKLKKFEQISKVPTPVTKKPPTPVDEELIKSSKIDFVKIANRSYFQRFIEELFKDVMPNQFKGVDFRVSKKVAAKQFDDKITEIERGSAEAYKKCMKELDEKLAKQKEKIENGTN